MEKNFTDIYENNIWGNNNNIHYSGSSGNGSSIEINMNTYIPFMKKFILDNDIKTIIDLGCGDFRIGPFIYNELENIEYTGYDVYKKIIEYNKTLYGLPKYNFIHLDFFNKKTDIISGDLCILKDVIQHWCLNDIYVFLDYLVESKKFKYILICNCFYQTEDNTEIDETAYFRPLTCDLLPLKKYNPIKFYCYHTKEISVIDCK